MDQDARIAALQSENDRLRGRIDQLESEMGLRYRAPIEWGLTPAEERILGCLIRRDLCTKDALMAALYRDDGRDEPQQKIIDVFVCKLRRKVRPYGVEIVTKWGEGYYLAPDSRRELAA